MSYITDLRNSLKEEKRHMPILQDGSAIIVVNNKNEILLQHRSDRNEWGLPGGCQEIGERFEEVAIRELKEETNLDVKTEDLHLISIISGKSRYNTYPNGDQVYNNTVLFFINNYSGELLTNNESIKLDFISLNNLPENLMDKDLIDRYISIKNKLK